MRSVFFAIVALTVALSGCVTTSSTPEPRLFATGPAVRVNGGPALHGAFLREGAEVSTGARSSARLLWRDGTFLQLDAQSDPLWRWEPPDIAVNLGFGWFLVDTDTYDMRVRNELAEVFVGSRAAIHIVPGRSFDLYLFSGTARPIRPEGRAVQPGEVMRVQPGGTISYRPLAPGERAAIERRFSRWNFPPVPLNPLVPGGAPFPGIPGGGGIDLNGGDDNNRGGRDIIVE